LLVLVVGLGFGLAGIKPIPAILLARALNGLLLPLVSVFLLMLIAVNDRELIGREDVNGKVANLLLGGGCPGDLAARTSGPCQGGSLRTRHFHDR
jgi:Mn2+/Fe2+ NRAMP family transporter